MRKMKDSGIEWIGQIPNDWSIVRIKNVSSLFGRIGFRGYTQQDLVDEDDGAITLSPSNMKNMKMNYEKCSYISWFKYNESPEIKVENGDILFVKTGSTYGKSAYVTDLPKEATINPQLIVFKQSTMNKKLLAYVLQTSLISYQTELAVVGGTIPTMSQEKIKNFIFPIPPLPEQKRIADFLDAKCADIDQIRADIEKQIEILTDYKKSVITEAVTKGLNPKAKLKDSGIEWIGKIPEGWNVKKLKYLCCTITDGSHFSPETTQEGKPYITVSDVYNDKIHYEEAAKISEEDFFILERNGCRPPKGAVLLSKDGTVGRTAIVSDNDYVVLSSLGILVPNLNVINSSYLKYLLDSPYLQEQMKLSMAGSALRRITISKISRFIGIVLSPSKKLLQPISTKSVPQLMQPSPISSVSSKPWTNTRNPSSSNTSLAKRKSLLRM